MSKGQSTTLYVSPLVAAIVHSNYQQVQLQLLSTYVYLHAMQVAKFLSRYTLHNFPFVPNISRAITSEPLKSKNKTLVANSTLLAVLQGLAILDLCSRGNMDSYQSHTTLRRTQLARLQVGTPAFTGISGCKIDTKSKRNVFTRTSGRQKRHLTVLAFLLYEQQNNNFIFTCTNVLEYESQHLLPEKEGVRIDRVHELIGCTNHQKFYGMS